MPLPIGEYFRNGGTDQGVSKEIALTYLTHLLDTYTPESERGYMVVVRMEIPEDLHDYWDYAPVVNRAVDWKELSPRQQRIKRRRHLQGITDIHQRARRLAKMMNTPGHAKLVPDLNPQDRKAIHIEHAQLLRKHGVVFTDMYTCYSYKQARIFKDVMDKHATKRALSTDEIVRDTEKIIMLGPYGKTLENKKGRCNFKVHTDPASFCRNACFKRTSDFRIQHYCEEDGSFLGTTEASKTVQVVQDTPRFMGWAILEYAKMIMTRFHYDTMKPLFGDALKLLYSDTDSMYYEIRWPTDPIDYIAEHNEEVFDLSQTEKYKDLLLKNQLGTFKYEGADNKDGKAGLDNEIVEAVFSAPKSYVKKMAKAKKGSTLDLKGKGVPGSVLQEQFGDSIDHHKEAVFKNRTSVARYRQFRSLDHVVKHCDVSKVALSAENDKVFQVSPFCSRPLGHFRNRDPVEPCPEWDLTDSEDEAVPLALEMLRKHVVPRDGVFLDVLDKDEAAADSNDENWDE
jgi:hypothetical protein